MRRHHKHLVEESKEMSYLQLCKDFDLEELKKEMINLRATVLSVNQMVENLKSTNSDYANNDLEDIITSSSQEIFNIGETLEMSEEIFKKLLDRFCCRNATKTSDFITIWSDFFVSLNHCIYDLSSTDMKNIFENSRDSISRASDANLDLKLKKSEVPKIEHKESFANSHEQSNDLLDPLQDEKSDDENLSDDKSENSNQEQDAVVHGSIASKIFNKHLLDQIEEYSNEDEDSNIAT
ncbi:MAG: hypothetical protein MHMPM18_003520 [Marteilia pararefringens]